MVEGVENGRRSNDKLNKGNNNLDNRIERMDMMARAMCSEARKLKRKSAMELMQANVLRRNNDKKLTLSFCTYLFLE